MLLAGLLHLAWQSRASQSLPAIFMLSGLPALAGEGRHRSAGCKRPIPLFPANRRHSFRQRLSAGGLHPAGPGEQLRLARRAANCWTPSPSARPRPARLLTTATAIGAIVAGLPGALLATLGIFLPSFVFVMLSAPFIPRLRQSQPVRLFLAGVHAAVVGRNPGHPARPGAHGADRLSRSALAARRSALCFCLVCLAAAARQRHPARAARRPL